jgi:tetratricopeptide (TPR) repeat protein
MKKMRLAGLAILGLTIATPAIADPAPQSASSAAAQQTPSELDQALALLHDGKPAEALALLDPIVAKAETEEAKDPKAACPAQAMAMLAAFMPRNLNFTMSVRNDWCEAMLAQGFALVELKRYDEAASRLGKLVQHDPGNANYLAEYAFSLRSSGQIDQALDAYNRAKSAASRYSNKAEKRHWRAVSLRGIGFVAFERQQWDVAEKAYRDSLKDEPGNQIALSELDLIRQKREK